MMDTIVIFGATGSVGVYTALFLKKKGYNIIAVGQRKSDNGFFAEYDIPYYSVNIANKNDFNILPVSGVDQVLHFAGAMPARMQGYDPYQYVNSIITGTLNVLEYIRKVNALKVIFTQSIADVLHLFGSTDPISPDSVRKFPLIGDHSIYSISKNAAVDLIEHYFNQYAIKRFILRLPTIYVYHPNPYYYVDGVRKWMGYRYLIDRAINGKELEIWGDPFSKKEISYSYFVSFAITFLHVMIPVAIHNDCLVLVVFLHVCSKYRMMSAIACPASRNFSDFGTTVSAG